MVGLGVLSVHLGCPVLAAGPCCVTRRSGFGGTTRRCTRGLLSGCAGKVRSSGVVQLAAPPTLGPMRHTQTIPFTLAALLLSCAHAAGPVAAPPSPYVGQQTGSIKALSDVEVDGYLKGEGMGMARAAELHHFPGPRHVLMLAKELALTDGQRQETERLFDTMHAKAVTDGARYIVAERELDAFFGHGGDPTPGAFAELVARAARLQGEVRAAHLEAHLAMVKVLTAQQIAAYDRLRGYENGPK